MQVPSNLSPVGVDNLAEDDIDSSYESFNLDPRMQEAFLQDEPPSGTLGPNKNRDRLVTVYRVHRSYYEGDLFENGDLIARLITSPKRKIFPGELAKPLFHWVHIENPQMKLEFFRGVVMDFPWLDTTQKASVSKLLKVVMQKSDRNIRMRQDKKNSYIDPEYYEEIIQSTVHSGLRSGRKQTDTMRWMCIPYFTKYERRPTSALDLPPAAVFMNADYNLNGKHFQVAELWVLLLGDDFLVSCAQRPIPELIGRFVDIKILPPVDPERRAVGHPDPRIIISDGGIRSWVLSVDDCKTWQKISAYFAELGVDFSDGWQLLFKDMKVTRKDWPSVISLVQRASTRLIRFMLKKSKKEDGNVDTESDQSSSSDSAPVSVVLPYVDHAGSPPPPSIQIAMQPKVTAPRDIFSLLAAIPANNTSSETVLTVDLRQLKEDTNKVHHYLYNLQRQREEAEAYSLCPQKRVEEVQAYVGPNHDRVHLFNTTKTIFSFFYPLTYEHTVTLKFWGAVDQILQDEQTAKSASRLSYTIRNITILSRVIKDIKEVLFSEHVPARYHTNLPAEFVQAWMHCLMYFILFTSDEAKRSTNHMLHCRKLLSQGKTKVLRRSCTVSLRDREAALPVGCTSLLIGELLGVRGSLSLPDLHPLTPLYWDELSQLMNEVREFPESKHHQSRFLSLKSDFETIIKTLEEQQYVLFALDGSISEDESKSVIVEIMRRSKGRESSITEFSLQTTKEALTCFREMERKRAQLESWHVNAVATAKQAARDHQSKATLTFTTVTVFFLPLTMLASVFGMNTSDVRNMNQKQWIFWCTAGPLCLVGLLTWLLYLGTIQRWYTILGKGDKGTRMGGKV